MSSDSKITSSDSQSLSNPSRRQVLGLGALGIVGIAFGTGSARAAAPASTPSGSLVSTVFGGLYEQAYRKAIVEPFQKATGSQVLLKLGMSSEWLTNAMVNRDSPEIDLMLLPYPDNVKAVASGLAMPLTQADIPNLKDIDAHWTTQFKGMGVALDYVGYGIAYREDLVPKAPKTWSDLWDPAYKGKVIVPNIGSWGSWEMLVTAARLNGGSESNMAPAFEQMKKLKPNVRQFFSSGVDITQLLGSGDAWVCGMTTNIPPYGLIDAGKPVKFIYPSDGAMAGVASYHIANKSKNAALCKAFINFALSPEAQSAFCAAVIAGPVNNKATLTDKIRQRVPARDKLSTFDWFKILPQMQDLTDQWNQEVAF